MTSTVSAESTVSGSSILRALAVVNPQSGNQSGSSVAGLLNELASARGMALDLRETKPDTDARGLVRDAKQFDRVIVSGGDGTIMQVMNGIARQNVPLAVIPAGTGNALAMALNLTTDLRQASEEALGDVTLMPLDLGLLNEELYFALRLSIGYEAKVTQDTTRELKTRFGKMAYVWQAVKHAARVGAIRYRFEVDGKVLRRRAESVWVANAGSLGVLGLDLDPNIIYNDGQLDLCVMRFSFRHDLQVILQRLFSHQRLPATVLSRVPIKEYVRIVTYPKQPMQVDGEVVETTTPCEIRVVSNAIQVCKAKAALPSDGQRG